MHFNNKHHIALVSLKLHENQLKIIKSIKQKISIDNHTVSQTCLK